MVLTFDETGNVAHRYLHGPAIDELFADESAVDGILWALSDRQGTVKDWVEYDSGTETTSVFNHVEYDAYGKITSQSNANHTITAGGYTGRYHDPLTGLRYHRARWTDPNTGWISEDPIGFNAGDVNLYRYVGNGPGNYVDPSGMFPPGVTEGGGGRIGDVLNGLGVGTSPSGGDWLDTFTGPSDPPDIVYRKDPDGAIRRCYRAPLEWQIGAAPPIIPSGGFTSGGGSAPIGEVLISKLRPPSNRPHAEPSKLKRLGNFDWKKYKPIIVETDGVRYWLMDGVTRTTAACRAGITKLPAYIYKRR